MFVHILYAACSLAGLIMVGGGIWLLAKQKIYLDHQTKEPIEVEVPGGVRFKANSPALALFLVGFIPLLYPVHKLNPKNIQTVVTVPLVPKAGSFKPQQIPLAVYASPLQVSVLPEEDKFRLRAPFVVDQDGDYEVLLLSGKWLVSHGTATLKDIGKTGEIAVELTPFNLPPQRYDAGEIDPIPDGFAQSQVRPQ